MFRDLSQQLNLAATVSVMTLALFAVSSTLGQISGGGSSNSASLLTLAAPIER